MGIEVAHYAGHASLGIGVASVCVPFSKHNQSLFTAFRLFSPRVSQIHLKPL
jgi:hypothetical protein